MKRLAFALLLVGCYDAPVETPVNTVTQVETHRFVPGEQQVDLLFLIDNSNSMDKKQTELKARFPQLIAKLDQLQADKPASYHIGVVTSDLGAAGACSSDDGGKLIDSARKPRAGLSCGALGGGKRWI